MSKSEIYSRIDENQKTLRRTLQYGVLLGFLKEEEDQFELTSRGSGLAYSPQFDEQEAVRDIFQEAIESYKPYREAIAGAYASGKIDDVNDDRAITQDSFREVLQKSAGKEVEDRKVNVLIKTAQAAGLGEYKHGRRGYQTRLTLSDEYESYAADLVDHYPLPSEEEPEEDEADEDDAEETGEELVQQPITESTGRGAEADEKTVTHIHIHVWADNEDEAVSTRNSIVERISGGGT